MEIPDIPIPVAAVFVPKIHFFNRDTTVTTVKISVTLLWGILCLLTVKFHYSEGSKSLLMN